MKLLCVIPPFFTMVQLVFGATFVTDLVNPPLQALPNFVDLLAFPGQIAGRFVDTAGGLAETGGGLASRFLSTGGQGMVDMMAVPGQIAQFKVDMAPLVTRPIDSVITSLIGLPGSLLGRFGGTAANGASGLGGLAGGAAGSAGRFGLSLGGRRPCPLRGMATNLIGGLGAGANGGLSSLAGMGSGLAGDASSTLGSLAGMRANAGAELSTALGTAGRFPLMNGIGGQHTSTFTTGLDVTPSLGDELSSAGLALSSSGMPQSAAMHITSFDGAATGSDASSRVVDLPALSSSGSSNQVAYTIGTNRLRLPANNYRYTITQQPQVNPVSLAQLLSIFQQLPPQQQSTVMSQIGSSGLRPQLSPEMVGRFLSALRQDIGPSAMAAVPMQDLVSPSAEM